MDYKEKVIALLNSEELSQEQKEVLKAIFPELAESEDERMKEAIIATIHLYYGEPLEDEAKEMISWIEKQGEKLTPKLEESENEKIRKAIMACCSDHGHKYQYTGITTQDMMYWLEKQKNTTDKEYVFRPLAGDTIEKAAEKAVELNGKVVLAFNGAYIPVCNKTKDEIVAEYHNWLEKQGN